MIRVTEDNGAIKEYERGAKEVEYDPPKWTPSPNSPDYVTLGYNENGNVNSKNTGMVTCVFKAPGTNTYYWQWNNENIWTQDSRSTGWKQKRANDGARYRIAQYEDGSLVKRTDEGFEYVDDPKTTETSTSQTERVDAHRQAYDSRTANTSFTRTTAF